MSQSEAMERGSSNRSLSIPSLSAAGEQDDHEEVHDNKNVGATTTTDRRSNCETPPLHLQTPTLRPATTAAASHHNSQASYGDESSSKLFMSEPSVSDVSLASSAYGGATTPRIMYTNRQNLQLDRIQSGSASASEGEADDRQHHQQQHYNYSIGRVLPGNNHISRAFANSHHPHHHHHASSLVPSSPGNTSLSSFDMSPGSSSKRKVFVQYVPPPPRMMTGASSLHHHHLQPQPREEAGYHRQGSSRSNSDSASPADISSRKFYHQNAQLEAEQQQAQHFWNQQQQQYLAQQQADMQQQAELASSYQPQHSYHRPHRKMSEDEYEHWIMNTYAAQQPQDAFLMNLRQHESSGFHENHHYGTRQSSLLRFDDARGLHQEAGTSSAEGSLSNSRLRKMQRYQQQGRQSGSSSDLAPNVGSAAQRVHRPHAPDAGGADDDEASIAMSLSESERDEDDGVAQVPYSRGESTTSNHADVSDRPLDWDLSTLPADDEHTDESVEHQQHRQHVRNRGKTHSFAAVASSIAKPVGHRRTRSGDGVAASLATGSMDWKGMEVDRIPLPTVGDDDDDEDEDGDAKKKGDASRARSAFASRAHQQFNKTKPPDGAPPSSRYRTTLSPRVEEGMPLLSCEQQRQRQHLSGAATGYGSIESHPQHLSSSPHQAGWFPDHHHHSTGAPPAGVARYHPYAPPPPMVLPQQKGNQPPFEYLQRHHSASGEDDEDDADSDGDESLSDMDIRGVQANRIRFGETGAMCNLTEQEQRFEDPEFRGKCQRVLRPSHSTMNMLKGQEMSRSPLANMGRKSTEKPPMRRSFLPQSSVILDDPQSEKKYNFYTCPRCHTRQREFFSVSDAPRKLEGPSGYLAFYFAIYVVASLFIFGLEEGWAPLDCIYFAVITLTTAGLGDYVPTTDANKIICSIFIYFGVACIGLLLGSYIASMLDDRAYRDRKKMQLNACPNCARLQTLREAAAKRNGPTSMVMGTAFVAPSSWSFAKESNPSLFMTQPRGSIVQPASVVQSSHSNHRRQHQRRASVKSGDATSEPRAAEVTTSRAASQVTTRDPQTPTNGDRKVLALSTEQTMTRPPMTPASASSSGSANNTPSERLTPNKLSPPREEESPSQLLQKQNNLLGSPLTRSILDRQGHTRHASIDVFSNFSMASSSVRSNTSGGVFRRKLGADISRPSIPTTISETDATPFSTAPPLPSPNAGDDPFGDSGSTDATDDDGDDYSSTASDSTSTTSTVDQLIDERKEKLKAVKYVFVTLKQALLNSLVIIAVGCFGFYFIEGFTLVNSWYFTTVLLTTVGYGDIAPVTKGGKLFATIYILVAGTILLNNMSLISMIPLELRKRRIERAVLTQFGDQLDDAALRELATGPVIQRLHMSPTRADGLDECTREMFSLAMLVRLGKVTEDDIRETFAAFRRLDVNNEGVLNSKSIIAAMIQKRKSQVNNLFGAGSHAFAVHPRRRGAKSPPPPPPEQQREASLSSIFWYGGNQPPQQRQPPPPMARAHSSASHAFQRPHERLPEHHQHDDLNLSSHHGRPTLVQRPSWQASQSDSNPRTLKRTMSNESPF